jgi:hypothetical protein
LNLKPHIDKWRSLPVGQGRIGVEKMLRMGDENLTRMYKKCMLASMKSRKWEYDKFSPIISRKQVLEIGGGLGYDGFYYSKFAETWTYADIVPENLELFKRLARLLGVQNVRFQLMEDIFHHNFEDVYNGFYAHGVLHHIPFQYAREEVKNIDRFLEDDTYAVVLMYPKERWVAGGKPDFDRFGAFTDGIDTPWAEYYTEEKIVKLFSDRFTLVESTIWGDKGQDLVTYELVKHG